MMEFNIEKVEALDYDDIKEQLVFIFKEEKDVVEFVNFLKNIQKFVTLSSDKRHTILIQLSYFKSQIGLFDKKINALLNRKKSEQTKEAIKRAKGAAEKITDNIIQYYSEDVSMIIQLEELSLLVTAWSNYMQDIYYMCSQTNKNLGSFQ